jgi:hypothetical protein
MNTNLLKIFKEDQKDRRDPLIISNVKLFITRDKIRKAFVERLVKNNEINTPKDYYMAAMIFHHGSTINDSKRAVRLAKLSADSGYRKGLSFYATCIDRLLIRQGKKQKFGTQFRKKNTKSLWRLLPFDKKTTDEERFKYGLLSLTKMKDNVEKLNKKI